MARTELGFRPQGLHLKAYGALTLGAVIFVLVVIGTALGRHGAMEIVGAILGLLIASAFIISGAYRVWGRLLITVDDDEWCVVTWRLGRYSRTKRFPRADVRSVRVYLTDAGFGSGADELIEVDIQREQRPLRIGDGFYLDREAMQAIASAFGCDLLPSSPD